MWWLLGCGIVTAAPLILFANGAKLLKLSTIGIMQYIAPTLIFFVAIFVFKEPFTRLSRGGVRADLGGPGNLFLVDARRRPETA